MHILVTSPIPSHPQNHGNRARIAAVCRALQKRGAQIHYVYGGLEMLEDQHELEMRETWDHVYILPRLKMTERKQSHPEHHLIDDWYVDAVTDTTRKILNTWRIDYCISNYVWFSKWLEQVPEGIPKYIDTHDVFADRHERLKADGLAASWFSTTRAQETLGLERADTVIAIQSEEAKTLRGLTYKPVTTLGHFIEADFLPASSKSGYGAPEGKGAPEKKSASGEKIVVGYLSSDNPINQQSLVEMNSAIRERPRLLEKYEFLLAGGICSSPAAIDTPFRKLGFVEDARAFYASTDIIINPNVGGTGLKIKSIEALAYGKALIATGDAMIGIQSELPAHKLSDAAAITDYLLALDPVTIDRLERAARAFVTLYIAEQEQAMAQLFPRLYETDLSVQNPDT